MVFDLLIAILVVVVAVALGLTVHPLFWLVIIFAALWLFGRRGVRGSRY